MRLINADSLVYKRSDIDGKQVDYVTKEDVMFSLTINATQVVYCRECRLHNQCYTEKAFEKLGYKDGFCRIGDKEF